MAAHRGGKDSCDNEPGEPGGKLRDHEPWVDRVASHETIIRASEPEARAHKEEKGELRDDEHPGPNECPLRVSQSPCGQEPLDDQVIGAVRCRGQKSATHQSAPEREKDLEGRPKVEHCEFPGIPGTGEPTHATREMHCNDERRDPT